MKFTISREVTTDECPWLPRDLYTGETVTKFVGVTYGCISPGGVAVSFDGGIPFFEVPIDALEAHQ